MNLRRPAEIEEIEKYALSRAFFSASLLALLAGVGWSATLFGRHRRQFRDSADSGSLSYFLRAAFLVGLASSPTGFDSSGFCADGDESRYNGNRMGGKPSRTDEF